MRTVEAYVAAAESCEARRLDNLRHARTFRVRARSHFSQTEVLLAQADHLHDRIERALKRGEVTRKVFGACARVIWYWAKAWWHYHRAIDTQKEAQLYERAAEAEGATARAHRENAQSAQWKADLDRIRSAGL